MPNHSDYCIDKAMHTRILNALWAELHGDLGLRPAGWHPKADEVAALRLAVVPNIGAVAFAILALWLQDGGQTLPLGSRGHNGRPVRVQRLGT